MSFEIEGVGSDASTTLRACGCRLNTQVALYPVTSRFLWLKLVQIYGKLKDIVYLVGIKSKWLIRVERVKPPLRDRHGVSRGTQP